MNINTNKRILTFSVRLVTDGNQNHEQNDWEVERENGTGSRAKFGSHSVAMVVDDVLRCCEDDSQRKKTVHAFAYLRSRITDDTETRRDETRRCYPVEQVVVNEWWWRRAFPLLQERNRSGAVGYRRCSVCRVRRRDIRGWRWYLPGGDGGDHYVVITVNFDDDPSCGDRRGYESHIGIWDSYLKK